MRVIGLEEIRSLIDEAECFALMEDAFRMSSSGAMSAAAVGHLQFRGPDGDCHIKSGHVRGQGVFVVKIASSFYANEAFGLSSSQGVMVVFDAATGRPLCLLNDEAYLTDLRTAVAGAVAARLIAPSHVETIGVIGAGVQARLQARWIARTLRAKKVLVWARSPVRAEEMVAELVSTGIPAQTVGSVHDAGAQSDLIVTATAARSPVLPAEIARPGLRIVAIGSDAVGKQELSADLVKRARWVVVDSTIQCLDFGEARSMLTSSRPQRMIELGTALNERMTFSQDDIVIADLTGLAIQDAQIAQFVWRRAQSQTAAVENS